MDLTQAIEARSDQLNADDLISGPRTFTITEVHRGDPEQPVAIVLAEFPEGRPFKPSKTVIRLLAYAWGSDTDTWPDKPRLTLYRDESVKWAGQAIGGIRVSHLSHIDKQLKVALAESKGKKHLHVINPLPADAPTSPPVEEGTVAQVARLRAEWKSADPARRKVIESEVNRLTDQPAPELDDTGLEPEPEPEQEQLV
jgi:hypothetical protein